MNKDYMNELPVLSFLQDSSFYLKAGKRQAEEGNLISALAKIRKAYEMEPTSSENMIALAEILNRMQRFEESTRVLLMNGLPEKLPSEGVFGLASDYIGMEEFIPARLFLLLYLQSDPKGKYAASAADYLSLFADKDEFAWQLGLDEGENIELIAHIHLSKAMHFSYLDRECLEYLKSLEDQFPDSLWLQTEIALSEFFLNKSKEAEFRAFNILKKDKNYVRAKCLLSYIRINNNKKLEAIELLKTIDIPTEPDLEALGMLTSVLLETGLYEKAEACGETMLTFLPFDPLTIHQTAYAKYMLGKREEALDLYRSILAMDPHDTVASYYLNWVEAHYDPSEGEKGFITSYDVSYGEALDRFHKMGHLFDDGIDIAREKWLSDTHLQDMYWWAMCSPFIPSKQTVFYALTALGGNQAISLLKNFLLKTDQSDEDKQRAFSALQLLNVTEPVSLYFRGNWQFSVSSAPSTADLPKAYAKIKHRLQDLPFQTRFSKDISDMALRYFDFYIQSLQGVFPRLSMFQSDAMAAALVYIALQTQQRPDTRKDVASVFSVSDRRMDNAINRLMCYLSDDQNSGDDI